jgi:hypothetical protein
MLVSEAQREVRTTYSGGFFGQLVSGSVWLVSAALGVWGNSRSAIIALVVGGFFIFPLTTAILLIRGLPSASFPYILDAWFSLEISTPRKGLPMRLHSLIALVVLAAPALAFGQDDGNKARTLAQEILDRGAALFDKRDASAMAATFVEDGEIIVFKRNSDSDRIQPEIYRGRAHVEEAYAKTFKDRLPEHRSRNTVELARLLTPDLLLIHGRFAMNKEQGDTVQFVQIRVHEDDQWKVVTMQLVELPKQNP